MENLLKETIRYLEYHGKTEQDVLFVIGNTKFIADSNKSEEVYNSWNWFKKNADINYHNGYGLSEIQNTLKIVGKDFWLERGEYDGSEWWEFKEYPKKPEKKGIIAIEDDYNL